MTLWRRNLIGAAVAVAAAAIIIGTQLYPPWSDYRDTVVPAHVVAPRDKLMAYGQTWQLGEIRHLNTSSNPIAPKLPGGTTLFVVTIDRSGSSTLEACVGVLTDGLRRWSAQRPGQFAAPVTDGATSVCGKPGRLQLSFLLPGDAVPTAVDITDFTGRIFLRVLL